MSKAAFCGTFDPVTKGHMDVIERASKLFDHVYVLIATNSEKTCTYSLDQRLDWLKEACDHLDNVSCFSHKGLSVDACKELGVNVMIRGIRNSIDFDYEQNIAFMNHYLDPSIETISLFTRDEYAHISSTNVKECLKYGRSIHDFVPECVENSLQKGKQ